MIKTEKINDNHFIIYTDDGIYLQSYGSIIAFKPKNGKIQLGKDWDYSAVIGRYRNQFLNETKEQTEAKLKSGEYILNESLGE